MVSIRNTGNEVYYCFLLYLFSRNSPVCMNCHTSTESNAEHTLSQPIVNSRSVSTSVVTNPPASSTQEKTVQPPLTQDPEEQPKKSVDMSSILPDSSSTIHLIESTSIPQSSSSTQSLPIQNQDPNVIAKPRSQSVSESQSQSVYIQPKPQPVVVSLQSPTQSQVTFIQPKSQSSSLPIQLSTQSQPVFIQSPVLPY